MTNFLTYLDFNGLINFDTESESTKIFLNNIIEQTQKKILIDLLGNDLYIQFENGLNETVIPQKWLDLRDGAFFNVPYNSNSYSLKFDGVKEILKYFTAYYYQIEIANKMTFAGQIKNTFENSTIVNQNYKLSRVYNIAVELYGLPFGTDNVEFLNPTKLECDTESLKSSCFNFIYQKNDLDNTTYSNWIFTPKKYIY